MKIFFLGGTSYLGKEIIRRLEGKRGFEISAYARSPQSADKLNGFGVQVYTELSEVPEQDVVLNLVVDYGKSKSLEEVTDVNVNFPMSVLDKIKFKTVINFSTGLGKEVSNYAYSKKALESKLEELSLKTGIQAINLHLQHFYGPNAPAHNFVTFLVTKMLANEELPLTDCQQRRDFIFTSDLLDAVEVLLGQLKSIKQSDTIEIGSGESVRLQDFVEAIKRISGSESKLGFGAIERRPNEPSELVADINKMKKLGWKPRTSLLEGLTLTVKNQNR